MKFERSFVPPPDWLGGSKPGGKEPAGISIHKQKPSDVEDSRGARDA